MKTKTLPEFTVEYHGYDQSSVNWTDGDRRYHFWIAKDGKPKDDILHSNPVRTEGLSSLDTYKAHRALDKTAKKWAPTIAAIMTKIEADGLAKKAVKARKDEMQAKAEAYQRAQDAKLLERLAFAAERLPRDIRDLIALLDEETRLRFAAALAETAPF